MFQQWKSCALTSHAAITDDAHDEPHTAAGPFLYEPAAPRLAPPAGSLPVAPSLANRARCGLGPMDWRESGRFTERMGHHG